MTRFTKRTGNITAHRGQIFSASRRRLFLLREGVGRLIEELLCCHTILDPFLLQMCHIPFVLEGAGRNIFPVQRNDFDWRFFIAMQLLGTVL